MKLLIEVNFYLMNLWFSTTSNITRFFLGIVMWLIGLVLLPFNLVAGLIYVMRYMDVDDKE